MKVSVRVTEKAMEIEDATGAEAAEVVREAFLSTILQRTPQLDDPDAVVVEAVDEPAAPSVQVPVFGETRAADVDPYGDLEALAYDIAGEEAPRRMGPVVAVDFASLPTGPFETWADIPVERRVFALSGVVHVAARAGAANTVCRVRVPGPLPVGEFEPKAFQQVCRRCVNDIERARRSR